MTRSIQIAGKIVTPLGKYTDGVERLEIYINKKGQQRFLNQDSLRVPVPIRIGEEEYIGGISFVDSFIWMNPDLKTRNNQEVKLAHILRKAGFKKNQKVTLKVEKWYVSLLPRETDWLS